MTYNVISFVRPGIDLAGYQTTYAAIDGGFAMYRFIYAQDLTKETATSSLTNETATSRSQPHVDLEGQG